MKRVVWPSSATGTNCSIWIERTVLRGTAARSSSVTTTYCPSASSSLTGIVTKPNSIAPFHIARAIAQYLASSCPIRGPANRTRGSEVLRDGSSDVEGGYRVRLGHDHGQARAGARAVRRRDRR